MGRRAWAIGVVTAAILAAGSGSSASAAIVGPPVADPSAVAFQTLLLGRSDEATVRFSAPSPVPFVTESVAVVGDDGFSVVQDGCSGPELRSTCSVTVRFHPVRAGDHHAVLRLDAVSGTTDVALSGHALCCTLSVAGATGVEGDAGPTDLPITVHRDGPADEPVTFTWRATPYTAGALDVSPLGETTTTMPAGVSDLALPIQILPDDVHEDTEAFGVELLGSPDAVIGSPAVATGTIEDDDPLPPPPPPRPTTTAEGDSAVEQDDVDTILTVPVALAQPATADTTYRVVTGPLGSATAGRDHAALPNPAFATVAAGSNVARATVRVIGDDRPEDVETIHVQLEEVFGARVVAQALVRILDDDTVSTVVASPTTPGPFQLQPGTGSIGFVTWRGGAPTGAGTLSATSAPRATAPRFVIDRFAGAALTDLTALSFQSCRTGADAPEVEISMTSGRVLRATTSGAVDAWQTFDAVDRPTWTVGFGGFTSLAQYEADHPTDRIATVAIVLPSTGAGGATAHVDRVLVGTTGSPALRYDLEPKKGTPKTVASGTCQASGLSGPGAPGGGLPGTG